MTLNKNTTPELITEWVPGLGGVVLCGGKSTRMGRDKSQLLFEGKTFLQHVVSRIAKAAKPIVISGLSEQESIHAGLFRDEGNSSHQPIFVSDQRSDCGPLEGIRTGLAALRPHASIAFVCGCDAPLLESRLIAYLASLIGNYQAVVPVDGKRIYGMTAIYRTDLADEISELLERDERRVKFLAQHFKTLRVPVDRLREFDPNLNSLVNVNREEDYQELLQRKF